MVRKPVVNLRPEMFSIVKVIRREKALVSSRCLSASLFAD